MSIHNSRSSFSRREFLQTTASASALSLLPTVPSVPGTCGPELPEAFSSLKPLGSHVKPIAVEEFRGRLQHAQKLMTEQKPRLDALFLAPGTSLYYFTGIRWGISERLLALVLPRAGEPFLVCPAFEEGRLREQLRFPIEIFTWQEDRSPTQIAAAALADHGIRTGRVGVEETAAY